MQASKSHDTVPLNSNLPWIKYKIPLAQKQISFGSNANFPWLKSKIILKNMNTLLRREKIYFACKGEVTYFLVVTHDFCL